MTPERWLPWTRGLARGARVVLCLPHAGGAAAAYRDWDGVDGLDDLRLAAVELPGHGSRSAEPAVERAQALAELIVREVVEPLAPEGLGLFGHSMGGLLAYLVTRELETTAGVHPQVLCVSGVTPPHVRRGPLLRPGDDVIDFVQAAGGISPAMVPLVRPASRKLLEIDFALIEGFAEAAPRPVQAPILALASDADLLASADNVVRWRDYTSSRFDFLAFSGDHFFADRNRNAIVAELSRRMS